jgi:trimethylamine--corrinoid protein Co-methyltransferase
MLPHIYDAARIVEGLDNIHFFQRPMVPRDSRSARWISTLYACVNQARRHVVCCAERAAGARHALRDSWRRISAPACLELNCFVVPPMKFAEDACGVLEACVEGGIPILLLSWPGRRNGGDSGSRRRRPRCSSASSMSMPSPIRRSSAHGRSSRSRDRRCPAVGRAGSADRGVRAVAQSSTCRAVRAGMTDWKLPDIQSGYEKGITDVMAGLAGLNLVYESAGMHASLLGFCLESLIIDNDMLGHCLRCVRGIEVTDEALSIDTIADVCLKGPGHYLGNEQTLRLMQTEYFYPAVGDRFSPKEWNEKGRPDILQRAIIEKKRILAERFPRHVPKLIDDKLRAASAR